MRALALQYHVREAGTAERAASWWRRTSSTPLARDLLDALHCLMGLKLRTRCASERQASSRATWCGRPT
jgi:hypothetical protein